MRTKSALFAGAALAAFATPGCVMNMGGGDRSERKYTQKEEMDAWMAVAGPGPEHQRMAAQAGEWNVAAKMWMDPAAPPEESKATARIRMIHDGRFQVMEYEGMMMGQPFRGFGLTGYDNVLKKYVGSWCDSMGTMMLITEGTCDATGKVITMTGSFRDPLDRYNTMREVATENGPDQFTFEMYGTCGNQPEHKAMELVFTRKK
jgi:hypothetical protein